jgi:5,10-methenyltetrahydrofolate synthetase
MAIDPDAERPMFSQEEGMDRQASRRQLRRDAIARRMALDPGEHERRSRAIREHLAAHFPQFSTLRVGFFWPMNQEPDLRPLFEAWLSGGQNSFAALLPVVVGRGAALAFRAWRPDAAMTKDCYGIPTPAVGEFVLPQALLIPLAAFDAAGFRLGYGGGYYDRTLACLRPRPLAVGVGFELSRVGSILPEPHDGRLDAVVTEAGVHRVAG